MDYSELTYIDGLQDAYLNIEKRKNTMKRAKMHRKKEIVILIKQKIIALILCIIAVIVPYYSDRDASASIIIIFLGIWLLFTKEHILFNR